MKTIPAPLAAHITQELTTLAWLLRLQRADATVLAFTTHDADLSVGGTLYKADGSFSATALEAPAGLAPANADLLGLIDSAAISETDIAAGRYDGAEITLSVCNWAAPADGHVVLRRGSVGTIAHGDGRYRFELKSMVDVLAQTVGDAYTKTCRHRLGNTACGIDLASASWRKTGTLTSVTSTRVMADSARGEASDFFAYGTLQFTSGANAGLTFDVRGFAGGTFTLWQPTPALPAVGDAYVAVAGCDKNYATCQEKFANALNFGGFPHIPGIDALLQTPDAKIS